MEEKISGETKLMKQKREHFEILGIVNNIDSVSLIDLEKYIKRKFSRFGYIQMETYRRWKNIKIKIKWKKLFAAHTLKDYHHKYINGWRH